MIETKEQILTNFDVNESDSDLWNNILSKVEKGNWETTTIWDALKWDPEIRPHL